MGAAGLLAHCQHIVILWILDSKILFSLSTEIFKQSFNLLLIEANLPSVITWTSFAKDYIESCPQRFVFFTINGSGSWNQSKTQVHRHSVRLVNTVEHKTGIYGCTNRNCLRPKVCNRVNIGLHCDVLVIGVLCWWRYWWRSHPEIKILIWAARFG